MAAAALSAGHDVVLVSGPVWIDPPSDCRCIRVETTEEMRKAAVAEFGDCDGVIAAAAVCDYKPRNRISGKIAKTGDPITIEMIETDDVLAELGRNKGGRWVVGFALEAENVRENALQKLRAKNCDWIVVNAPSTIGAEATSVEIIDRSGQSQGSYAGSKHDVAVSLIESIETHLSAR